MEQHIYHFLITNQLVNGLNNINEFANYVFSKKIIFILNKTDKITKYLKNIKIDEGSNVEYLVSKKNIHLYMKNNLFKKIKYYHGKFNIYSMAKYVRMIIRIFLEMVEKYGYIKTLKILEKHSNKLIKIQRIKNRKQLLIQLSDYFKIKSFEEPKIKAILTKLLL